LSQVDLRNKSAIKVFPGMDDVLQSGVEKKIDFQKLRGGKHIQNVEVYCDISSTFLDLFQAKML